MGHDAFVAHTIIDKLPVKIECLEVWNQELLVGTEQGYLLRYEILRKSEAEGSGYRVSIKNTNKAFSRKPVQQLSVVSGASILLSLSDGFIHVHDLPSFSFLRTVSKSKGCHLYTVETIGDTLWLCAAIKKKIVLYCLEGGNFVEKREINVPDAVRTMVWSTKSVCIGVRSKYYMINIGTGGMKEIFGTGSSRNALPIATRLPEQILVTVERNIGVFLDLDGKPTKKWGLTWSEPPLCIEFAFPFCIGILSRFVEVRTVFEGSTVAVQTMPLKGAKILCVKDNNIFVGSSSHIWKLTPVPMALQIQQLLEKKSYNEALVLSENLPADPNDEDAKTERIKFIRYQYANHQFRKGHYEDAMEMYEALGCNPFNVLTLYPNLLPAELQQKFGTEKAADLDGASLKNALQALVKYLSRFRDPKSAESAGPPNLKDDYSSCTSLADIVDTVLLQSYIKLGDSISAQELLNSPNCCHIKECEKVLAAYQKFHELVLLYKSKGLHQRALEMLAKLGTQPGPLQGPRMTIRYLKTLGSDNIEAILQFSKWPLEIAPTEALDIFTADRLDGQALPPDVILRHIQSVKSAAAVISTPYLEWLINDCGVTSAEFHNDLVFRYLETVTALKKEEPKHSPVHKMRAGSEPGLLGVTRGRLLGFLKSSHHYNAEKMLSRFPMDDMFEERAVLLSRIGQHEQALSIYAHRLGNTKMAEEYCALNYDENSESSRDVYVSLLAVYMKPPPGIAPLYAPALELLNQHFSRINPAKALEMLPANVPIKQMYFYFESVLRDRAEKKRNNQVVAALLKSENLQVRERSIAAKSRSVRINEDRLCPVCNRHISGVSAIAVYPNGTVVHFGCLTDRNSCPVTGTQFNTRALV